MSFQWLRRPSLGQTLLLSDLISAYWAPLAPKALQLLLGCDKSASLQLAFSFFRHLVQHWQAMLLSPFRHLYKYSFLRGQWDSWHKLEDTGWHHIACPSSFAVFFFFSKALPLCFLVLSLGKTLGAPSTSSLSILLFLQSPFWLAIQGAAAWHHYYLTNNSLFLLVSGKGWKGTTFVPGR